MGGFSSVYRRERSSVWRERRVDGVILPQRVAFPVVREKDPPEVGMALEDDAEHVVALALHPVGAAIERGQRRAARLSRRQPGAHRDDQRRLEILNAAEHLESLLLPAHRGRPLAVAAAGPAGGDAGAFFPALARP